MNKLFIFFLCILFPKNATCEEKQKADFFRMIYAEETVSFSIDTSFEKSGSISLENIQKPIYGLSIDMEVERLSHDYLVRVVMEDQMGHVYLVAEDYTAINIDKKASYDNYAEETKKKKKKRPKVLRIHAYGAIVHLKSINYSTSIDKSIYNEYTEIKISSDIRKEQARQKCSQIACSNINKKELWIADVTQLSLLPFEDRIRLIGCSETGATDGIEFYLDGVFRIRSHDDNNDFPRTQTNITNPHFATEFSWRNRHGKDWMTSIKDQGRSGYCSAFSAISCVEALVNLYFNQLINIDLSEQEAAVCNSDTDPWTGMSLQAPLNYIKNHGVCEEDAYPFVNDSVEGYYCRSGEISPTENVKITDYRNIPLKEDSLKKALIKYGPLSSGYRVYDYASHYTSAHAMSLYGYGVINAGDTVSHMVNYAPNSHGMTLPLVVEEDNELVGRTVWRYKNSYINGDASNPQYMNIVFDDIRRMDEAIAIITPVTSLNYDETDIICEDADGDGFFNWGIGPKPVDCPQWIPDEEDGNDSNILEGPMDEFGNITYANPDNNPIMYINNDTATSSPESYHCNAVVQNGATWTIAHDHIFNYGSWIRVKAGSRLIINGCALASARLILEPGSTLVVTSGGAVISPSTEDFNAPIGAIVDILNGSIQ